MANQHGLDSTLHRQPRLLCTRGSRLLIPSSLIGVEVSNERLVMITRARADVLDSGLYLCWMIHASSHFATASRSQLERAQAAQSTTDLKTKLANTGDLIRSFKFLFAKNGSLDSVYSHILTPWLLNCYPSVSPCIQSRKVLHRQESPLITRQNLLISVLAQGSGSS